MLRVEALGVLFFSPEFSPLTFFNRVWISMDLHKTKIDIEMIFSDHMKRENSFDMV